MKLRLGWIAGGVLALLFFLLMYLPASQVVGRLSLPNGVNVVGVSGTVWQGRAQQVQVSGLFVNDLSWDVHPWSLLMGRLSLDVKGGNLRQSEQVAFAGPVSVNLFNLTSMQTEDFLLFLPVDRVLAEVQLPLPVNAGGRFRVKLDELKFGPTCERLSGSGDWLNATVAGTQGPIDFGSYHAQLRCEGEAIGIQVSEPNKLGLSMTATISADLADIQARGQFKIDDSLPQEVHDASRLFSTPDADGYTRFDL